MKIIEVATYRDGGTVMIDTDSGRFWIPIGGQLILKGDSYFHEQRDEMPIATHGEMRQLVIALAPAFESLGYIKRHFGIKE